MKIKCIYVYVSHALFIFVPTILQFASHFVEQNRSSEMWYVDELSILKYMFNAIVMLNTEISRNVL